MPGRAWTPEEKIQIVLESMNTNISLAELCRTYNLSPGVFYQWKEKFMKEGRLALSGGLRDPAKEKEAEINRLKKLIGELTIVNESMKEVLRGEGKNDRRDYDEQGTEPQEGSLVRGLVSGSLVLQAEFRDEEER